jgi:hypothetical protein
VEQAIQDQSQSMMEHLIMQFIFLLMTTARMEGHLKYLVAEQIAYRVMGQLTLPTQQQNKLYTTEQI